MVLHSRRLEIRDRVLEMDPERDHVQIARLSGLTDFGWDTTRALELALFRTFAVPRISGLLARTGEFTRRPQRRYDDTDLLIAEFVEHGYDSPRGQAAIARMNALHARFRIRNDDLLYVLSTFVFEPARWIAAYGWRELTDVEREAAFWFWRQVGLRMGIRGIPADRVSLEAYNLAYERAEFRYAPSNVAVATATRDLFCSWLLPRPLWVLGARAVHGVLDLPLLDAFGFAHPTAAERRLVGACLRARARAQRALPPRRSAVSHTRRAHPSYPHGYRIGALGPAPSDSGLDGHRVRGVPGA